MSIKGKRELPKSSVNEKETPGYPMVSRGNNEEDRLDTERRLEERRRQRALAQAAEEAARKAETAEDEEGAYDEETEESEGSYRAKTILIVVCVLLAIILAGLMVYRTIFVKPELGNNPDPKPGTEDVQKEEVEIDVGDGLQPMISGERKSEDFYTFLIIGRDTSSGNCDTMLLASYDMANQKVTVMSVPRDTMVNVPWDVKKINSVYPRYGGGEKGIEKLKTEISQLVGFKPDYTVVVEWEAVGEMVDAIGGVWFDVPYEMRYWDPYQDLAIVVDKGYQKLDGEKAMGVIRWRHNSDGKGYPDGDLGRIATQQAFLKEVVKQMLQVKNAVKLFEFAQIFEKNVTTELSVQNIFWLAKGAVMGGLSMDNVEFVTMPNRATSCWSRLVKNMQSYVVPRPTQLLELVNTKLSPFTKVFTLSDLDIMSVNKDGSVSSTTGVVADAPAALPPEIPKDEEEEVIITDPNDPNYDPTKDPNNPAYIPPEERPEDEGTEGEEGDFGESGEGVIDNGEGIGSGSVTPPENETPPAEESTPSAEETVPPVEEPLNDPETGEYDPASGGEAFIDDGTGW